MTNSIRCLISEPEKNEPLSFILNYDHKIQLNSKNTDKNNDKQEKITKKQ